MEREVVLIIRAILIVMKLLLKMEGLRNKTVDNIKMMKQDLMEQVLVGMP